MQRCFPRSFTKSFTKAASGVVIGMMLVTTFFTAHSTAWADEVARELTLGVLAFRSMEDVVERWQPLADYLGESIPGVRVKVRPLGRHEAEEGVGRGEIHLLLVNPYDYTGLALSRGVSRISTIRPRGIGDASPMFGAVVFQRADSSPMSGLEALEGKRVAAAGPDSFPLLAIMRELKALGHDPSSFFGELVYTGLPHVQIVEKVLSGEVDAGIVRTSVFEELTAKGQIPREALRVLPPPQPVVFHQLVSSRLYPEWPLAIAPSVEPSLARRILSALLAIEPDSPVAIATGIDGWGPPLDYSEITALMQELHLGPFAQRGELGVLDAALKLGPWLAVVTGMGLLLFALFTMRINNRLQRAQVELSGTLRAISDAVIRVDREGRIRYVNAMTEKVAGLSSRELGGRPLLAAIPLRGLKGEPVTEDMILKYSESPECDHIVKVGHHDTAFTARLTAAALPAGEGMVLVLHDISELHQLNERLAYEATHDMLTGLLNRLGMEGALESALDVTSGEHVFIYIDLDDFKLVNDTAGHDAGDALLRQVGNSLRGRLRTTDRLARLGGDEFGVLLNNCSLQRGLEVAETLRAMLDALRFNWHGQIFRIGGSFGVVGIQPGVMDKSDIFKMADSACYLAKEAGRNQVHAFRPDDERIVRNRGHMGWVNRIRQALDEQRLKIMVQPVLPVSDTGGPVYMEVLVRMLDEDGAMIAPGAFLPAAERYHLMKAIDQRVIELAFADFDRVLAHEHAMCAINLSGQSIGSPSFREFLCSALDRLEQPSRLCFEITETAAIANIDQAFKFMDELRKRGCLFALDDFGSGLSSFGYLKQLPVDFLKIDGIFVRNMLEDAVDLAMIESIHAIGKVMGLQTIAEFVENEGQAAALRMLGIDYLQGFGIARPMPLDQLAEFMRNH